MHLPATLFIGAGLIELVTAAAIGGAGYDTSRLGPSNAVCERKTYTVSAQANNTVYETPLSPNISEVSYLSRSSCSVLTLTYISAPERLIQSLD